MAIEIVVTGNPEDVSESDRATIRRTFAVEFSWPLNLIAVTVYPGSSIVKVLFAANNAADVGVLKSMLDSSGVLKTAGATETWLNTGTGLSLDVAANPTIASLSAIGGGARPPPPLPPDGFIPPPSTRATQDSMSIALGPSVVGGFVVLAFVIFVLRHRRGRSASACGESLAIPPQRWPRRKKYACFLSHYKHEAGSDARYLHGLLKNVLGADIFLDSANLDDLRLLFEDGIARSDCVVVLATRSIFTRPWVLLEIWECHVRGTPVVIFAVEAPGRSFDATKALVLLDGLETDLEASNQGALRVITEHLAQFYPGVTIDEFKAALIEKLGLHGPWWLKRATWHPHGSDARLRADIEAIIARMRTACKLPPWKPLWSWSLRRLPSRSQRQVAMISYHRAEAGSHARLVQRMLEAKLNARVFLDATDATDLNLILTEGVRKSEAMLLLQTEGVLRRPWVLLELDEATQRCIPIVPVFIVGGGYDYDRARQLLDNLEVALDEEALELLRSQKVSIPGISQRLSAVLPSLISVPLDPAEADDMGLNASVEDIAQRLNRASRQQRQVGSAQADSSRSWGGTSAHRKK